MKKPILYLLSLILIINTILGGCVYNPNKNDEFLPVPNKNETVLQAFYWEMGTEDYLKNYPEEKNLWLLLAQKQSMEQKKN